MVWHVSRPGRCNGRHWCRRYRSGRNWGVGWRHKLAHGEDPDTDHVAMFPNLRQLQIVQQLDELGYRFAGLERNNVQFATGMMFSRPMSPREYESMAPEQKY